MWKSDLPTSPAFDTAVFNRLARQDVHILDRPSLLPTRRSENAEAMLS